MTKSKPLAPTKGPYQVQPLAADHGATLAIVAMRERVPFTLATIEPLNNDDEDVTADSAERDPDDLANAELLKDSWALLAALQVAYSALKSYQFHNSSPVLAEGVCNTIEKLVLKYDPQVKPGDILVLEA